MQTQLPLHLPDHDYCFEYKYVQLVGSYNNIDAESNKGNGNSNTKNDMDKSIYWRQVLQRNVAREHLATSEPSIPGNFKLFVKFLKNITVTRTKSDYLVICYKSLIIYLLKFFTLISYLLCIYYSLRCY